MSGIAIDNIEQVSMVFRANGENYAVNLSSVSKELLFAMLSALVEGRLNAIKISSDFTWEPVANHVENG